MALTQRKRVMPYRGSCIGTVSPWVKAPSFTSHSQPTVVDATSVFASLDGTQITESENHPGWRSPRKWGTFNGDLGGEFFTTKSYVQGMIPEGEIHGVKDDGDGWVWHADYSGPILPCPPSRMSFLDPTYSNDDTLGELGATAIARCAPTKPTADLAVMLGEIAREGLPKLAGATLRKWGVMSARQRRKAMADEYLNYQFGWKPLIHDIRTGFGSIVHGGTIIDQYRRDAGKMVRRGYHFRTERSSETEVLIDGAVPYVIVGNRFLYLENHVPIGRVIRESTIRKERWFKGAFTYTIPDPSESFGSDLAWQVLKAKKALGLRLSPEVLWNLAPWSWAVDWFTNVGDYLQNLDAWIFDGQVLGYGYMMEHTLQQNTYTFVGETGFSDPSAGPGSLTLVTETKKRIQASPYGFGLTWDGFSTTQKAILGALGISRGSKGK